MTVFTCTTDDQSGIDLKSISTKCWILKKLLEIECRMNPTLLHTRPLPIVLLLDSIETHDKSLNVSLQPDVWQIGHHVSYDLEASVLGQLERLADSSHSVASVGVPRHVLIDALNSDLQSGAPIRQHLAGR